METLARVRVLVEVRSVEVAESVLVAREMGRHPVEQHANAALVEIVDEVHEVLRSPIAARWSEVPGRLVAPGAIKRMLHDGHEFHVGETQALDVRGQFGRNLAIAQRTMLLFRNAHP